MENNFNNDKIRIMEPWIPDVYGNGYDTENVVYSKVDKYERIWNFE